MSDQRHFTTRRSFVGAMGFGALGLYATWAAYGASPLPFFFGASDTDANAPAGNDGHPEHAAPMPDHANPTMVESHGTASLAPEDFELRHADFLTQFRQADGSIRPIAATAATHVGHDMAAMAEPSPGENADQMAEPGAGAPVEVYLAAGRFFFEPDALRLEAGRAYRFHMMATDVAHGASIAFGRASRIVRLRPDTVTTLDLTFLAAGTYLVYCTVYCGPGHDMMRGQITVA